MKYYIRFENLAFLITCLLSHSSKTEKAPTISKRLTTKDSLTLAQDEFDAMKTRLNEYYHWVNEEGLFLYQIPSSKPETIYQFTKFELQDISL